MTKPSTNKPGKQTKAAAVAKPAEADVIPLEDRDLSPQQETFILAYYDPRSPTFGNTLQSALYAGYSDSTARQMTRENYATWLTDNYILRNMTNDHVLQGIQDIAIRAQQSKSPDDTRLKAYELLARIKGMMVERQQIQHQIITLDLTGAIHIPDSDSPTDTN